MKALIAAIFVPAFGIAIAFGLIEIAYRWSSSHQAIEWSDRPLFYVKDRNAVTMQGPAYAPQKPEGIFRVAVVGDSFSFAPYMQFTDTFSYKLQELLNVNGGARRAEVINYGVPAYSTSHEIAVAERAVAEGADLVILQITLNDPELKLHRPTGITENMNDHFGPFEPKGKLKRICSVWTSLCWVLVRLHNNKTRTAYVDYFSGLYTNPRTWEPYKAAMKRLVKIPKEKKIPIVAVVFPLFGLPMDAKYPFYPVHAQVKSLLDTLQVPNADVSSIYMNIPLERLQVIPGVDRHPNEIAHRMAAEHLYLWLEKMSLVPEELRVPEMYGTRLGIDQQRKLEQRPEVPW